MPKNRLEAFSDGVIAIVITLLVLEIHVPQLPRQVTSAQMWQSLSNLAPGFLAYIISFLVCAVWWVSHHNFIHDLDKVDRPLLWANNIFLLWLAFLPFPTGLLGQHPDQPIAAMVYGVVGALTGLSFFGMRWYASLHGSIMRPDIPELERHRRLRISMLSPGLYLIGAALSLIWPIAGMIVYAAVPVYFAIASLSGGRSISEAE
jgi:uncharacterized membrane protein